MPSPSLVLDTLQQKTPMSSTKDVKEGKKARFPSEHNHTRNRCNLNKEGPAPTSNDISSRMPPASPVVETLQQKTPISPNTEVKKTSFPSDNNFTQKSQNRCNLNKNSAPVNKDSPSRVPTIVLFISSSDLQSTAIVVEAKLQRAPPLLTRQFCDDDKRRSHRNCNKCDTAPSTDDVPKSAMLLYLSCLELQTSREKLLRYIIRRTEGHLRAEERKLARMKL